MKKPGIFQGPMRREQDRERAAINTALQGGVTSEEWAKLQTDIGSQNIKPFFRGAAAQQGSAMNTLRTTFPSLGGQGSQPGQPGLTAAETVHQIATYPTATQTVGPSKEAAAQQLMTQAEQERTSQEAIKNQAGQIAQGVSGAVKTGQASAGALQTEARGMKEGFDTQAQALAGQVQQMPDQVSAKFDAALGALQPKIDAAAGVIDTKETAALAGVMQGKSAAMQAAVQGIQGQIRNTVAQIQADPNLTDAQKQQMIAQTRMQGAAQMAPAVGQTQLQFNTLQANTATAFGQMATSIQQTGLASFAQMATAGAEAYANSTNAANQIGAHILDTQANADNNYLTSQGNLVNLRASLEMQGATLKAQLLPVQGVPYADYGSVQLLDTQMTMDLWKADAQQLGGTAGLQIMQDIAKSSNNMSWLNTLLQVGTAVLG
jgi:hypothetical protein